MARRSKRRAILSEVGQIILQAQRRWLRPAELCEIIQNRTRLGLLDKPANMPKSGELFLYDRKVRYRDDGHRWKKPIRGNYTKEPHEKLKDEGVEVLHCYYAHGEENGNFQRRIYRMIDPDLSHIVLVHYREVESNRQNFKETEEVVPSSNEIEELAPNPEIQNYISSSFISSNFKMHSQAIGTTSLNTAQASEFKNAESAYYHQASFQFQPFPELRQPMAEQINAEGLKPDNFNLWMRTELEYVYEPQMQSSAPLHLHLDSSMLAPSPSSDQLFRIIDFSPNWAYENSSTKVLITGRFFEAQHAKNCKWSCMFGEFEVPAEVIADGVLRCYTPVHKAGRLRFYVTCSNRLPCSEVQEFEYREDYFKHYFSDCSSSNETLNMRFEKLLSSSSTSPNFDPTSMAENSKLSGKLDKLLQWLSDKDFFWVRMNELSLQPLKEKFHAWLLQQVAAGGKGPSVLDEGGQGVLHFGGALGYDWVFSPMINAGVSVNFRDVNGWTALHWAAFCGRPRTVTSLINRGAFIGALTYATTKYPTGQTPADLASEQGHKGIAGYLAEYGLHHLFPRRRSKTTNMITRVVYRIRSNIMRGCIN